MAANLHDLIVFVVLNGVILSFHLVYLCAVIFFVFVGNCRF